MIGTKESIQITWKSLSREEIDSLHDFLKAQKNVTHVYSRVPTMEAACDPSAHVAAAATIVGLAIGISKAVGQKALEIATDLTKEWFRQRRTGNIDAEITLLYDADDKPLVKVKKRDLK